VPSYARLPGMLTRTVVPTLVDSLARLRRLDKGHDGLYGMCAPVRSPSGGAHLPNPDSVQDSRRVPNTRLGRRLVLEFRMDAAFFQRDVFRLLAGRLCRSSTRPKDEGRALTLR
jgi:hypothetical protein